MLQSLIKSPIVALADSGVAGMETDWLDEASALFARMSLKPTYARAGHVNTLIGALKTAGIWSALDTLYVLAAHDAQAARLNWKGNAAFDLTAVNAPTFTTDRGYAGNGTSSYLDTQWDAATNGSAYTRDSASLGFWGTSEQANSGALFGTGTDGVSRMVARSAVDLLAYRINNTSAVTTSNTTALGLYTACRTGASVTQAYKNGSALGSAGSQASEALSTSDFNIHRVATVGFSPARVGVAFTGAGFDADENLALYNALNDYMTAVGAA